MASPIFPKRYLLWPSPNSTRKIPWIGWLLNYVKAGDFTMDATMNAIGMTALISYLIHGIQLYLFESWWPPISLFHHLNNNDAILHHNLLNHSTPVFLVLSWLISRWWNTRLPCWVRNPHVPRFQVLLKHQNHTCYEDHYPRYSDSPCRSWLSFVNQCGLNWQHPQNALEEAFPGHCRQHHYSNLDGRMTQVKRSPSVETYYCSFARILFCGSCRVLVHWPATLQHRWLLRLRNRRTFCPPRMFSPTWSEVGVLETVQIYRIWVVPQIFRLIDRIADRRQ